MMKIGFSFGGHLYLLHLPPPLTLVTINYGKIKEKEFFMPFTPVCKLLYF